MLKRRITECVAMMMIGDAALALWDPYRHMKLWEKGPPFWRHIMRPFVENPGLTRCIGIAELAAGLWLAQMQRPARSRSDA